MKVFISYWFETHAGAPGIDNLLLDINAIPATRSALETAERCIMDLHGRQNGTIAAVRVRIINMMKVGD